VKRLLAIGRREVSACIPAGGGVLLGLALALAATDAAAQLFTNIDLLLSRFPVGCQGVSRAGDGPKGIASADFDGDGIPDLAFSHTDGSVNVYFGRGDGKFEGAKCLPTGARELRGIVCADFTGDGHPDIATASPRSGLVYLFIYQGARSFSATNWTAWRGVRNLAAGDFDADGRVDLVVAGPSNGLRHYRNLPGGGLAVVTNLTLLSWPNLETNEYRPVYSLKAFRPPGSIQDELVATHASTNRMWILAASAGGALEIRGSITNREETYSLDVGSILQPTNSGVSDLVAVQRDAGTLEIHAGTNSPERFAQAIQQRLDIPGGPRAVRLEDLDGDGWNDLVVVVRNFDEVLTYRNSNGVFIVATERPVGTSPRELVSADFTGDAQPDVAVMNRISSDVDVLATYPGNAGFTAVDHLYLVDGEVAGLSVYDFNRDGRDDVIQLHRSSGDFSVRLADTNGTLGPPVFYTVGQLPSAQVVVDVNNDGLPDQVAANLGLAGIEQASMSVRLGLGGGQVGPEQRFYLSNATEQVEGRLFALVAADLDGHPDGNIDLAAGFLDSRLAFFKGNGDGTFTFTRAHEFVNEARSLVAGDFDQDGDLDIAGVGVSGELVVVENRGDLLFAPTLTRTVYPPPASANFGARALKIVEVNNDGDPDLLLGSGNGAVLYHGASGVTFVLQSALLPGTDFPVSSVVSADFDDDGLNEVVVAGRVLDVITLLKQTALGTYTPAVTMDVPSSKFLATGDLDGDGFPDLVGSGRILWTALSGHSPHSTPPLVRQGQRQTLSKPLINEILAINTSRPLEQDGDRFSDWVEIFNGTNRAVSFAGWRLRSVDAGEAGQPRTNEFAFPATAYLQPGSHLVIICSTNIRTIYHTGFKLPGDGGTLTLFNPGGAEVDRVQYPAQQENVSYARYRDALQAFVFNPYPSPGRANPDNGRVGPIATFDGLQAAGLGPGQPLRFYATARDDIGVASVSVLVQRLDHPNAIVQRVVLRDDGQHDDGAANDHRFAGELDGGLVPAGAEFQFYLEVVDLSEQIATVPEDPQFGLPGEPGNVFAVAIGQPAPALELSELVALNQTSLMETNETSEETPDWVEIRNYSSSPLSLAGLALAKQVGGNSAFYFPTGQVLLPGQHFVVLCDGNTSEGPLHAPFSLKSSGDQVLLLDFTTNGAAVVVDYAVFGALPTDIAWARLGAQGSWQMAAPTPYSGNLRQACWGLVPGNGTEWVFRLAFPTLRGITYIIEQTPTLSPPAWTPLPALCGDGIEKVVTWPLAGQSFFRVRQE
jgi:hypothetical protein